MVISFQSYRISFYIENTCRFFCFTYLHYKQQSHSKEISVPQYTMLVLGSEFHLETLQFDLKYKLVSMIDQSSASYASTKILYSVHVARHHLAERSAREKRSLPLPLTLCKISRAESLFNPLRLHPIFAFHLTT